MAEAALDIVIRRIARKQTTLMGAARKRRGAFSGTAAKARDRHRQLAKHTLLQATTIA